MSGRRREGGTWAAASGNCCFLFGRWSKTSQTAEPETTANVGLYKPVRLSTHTLDCICEESTCVTIFPVSATASEGPLRLILGDDHLWRFCHDRNIFMLNPTCHKLMSVD